MSTRKKISVKITFDMENGKTIPYNEFNSVIESVKSIQAVAIAGARNLMKEEGNETIIENIKENEITIEATKYDKADSYLNFSFMANYHEILHYWFIINFLFSGCNYYNKVIIGVGIIEEKIRELFYIKKTEDVIDVKKLPNSSILQLQISYIKAKFNIKKYKDYYDKFCNKIIKIKRISSELEAIANLIDISIEHKTK